MARNSDLQKIDDLTKRQVTFSKRRSSLMRKANELSVCCGADVAFVAFSPTAGRVSQFCNRRIEDVLYRYVCLPVETRLSHISDVQRKMEKLQGIAHINGEARKLHYLDNQIENLQLQIAKRSLEMEMTETNLRDYEVDPEAEPSLNMLTWCERNLKHSLENVTARKDVLISSQPPPPPNFQRNDHMGLENQNNQLHPPNFNQDHEPMTPAYSVGDGILHNLFEHENELFDFLNSGNICGFSLPNPLVFASEPQLNHRAPPQVMAEQEPLVADQTLLNLPEQNNHNIAWSQFFEAGFADEGHLANNSFRPLISTEPIMTDAVNMVIPPQYHQIGTNFNNQFGTLMEEEPKQLYDLDALHDMLMSDDNAAGEDDYYNLNNNHIWEDEFHAAARQPHSPVVIETAGNEITQDDLFDALEKEKDNAAGDDGAAWGWEDLVRHYN